MTGIIFSDLGQASSFMALDWVQEALQKSLGLPSFSGDTQSCDPGTPEDAQVWEAVQSESAGIAAAAGSGGHCGAQALSS